MNKITLKQNIQNFGIGFNRRFPTLTIAVLIFITSVSVASNDTELIKIRGHYNYPPFEYLDASGDPTGYNVEILNAVVRLADLKIQLELGPWREIYSDLESGNVDVLMGMYYSNSRAEKFDFTIPYITVSYTIFCTENSQVRNLDDLHGKDIVLVEGGISIDFIAHQDLTSKIHQVASAVDALRLLAAGSYDCTLIPEVQGHYIIQQLGFDNLKAVGPQLLPRNLGFALKKGNPELLAKLNEGLRSLEVTGQMDRFHKNWIEIYEKRNYLNQQTIRITIWIGIIFFLVFLVGSAWVATLRKRVVEKTLGLRQEIGERKRIEDALQEANQLQEVIYKIANAASGSGNLDELFSLIRQTLHQVIDTTNFYIALIDEEKEELYFPHAVDEQDDDHSPIPVTSGLTGYIIRMNKSAIFTKDDIYRLVNAGDVEKIGTPSEQWLGTPLRIGEKVIGAVVVQSYRDQNLYNHKGLEILEFVSYEVASAIHNKQNQEAIKNSEEKYRILSGQLAETNSMKELLLDVITHDLKNPAGVINGLSELLIEDYPDNQELELVGESCSNLLKVIDNATIVSKVTLGDEIAKEDIDLVKMIHTVAAEFDSSLKASGMEFHCEYDQELIIKANPIIAEVFKNYVSNAIKYSADGKKIVVEIQTDDHYVTVNFIDFGPTVPEKKRPLVFTRGVQLDKAAKHGRGLGLAIVKRIAEAHDAEVGVLPNSPNGNIFYIRFPDV